MSDAELIDELLAHIHFTARTVLLSTGNTKLRQRMMNPEPGDLVIETSAWSTRSDLTMYDKVGWLLYTDGESYWVVEPWDRRGESDAAVTWDNSQWIGVPHADMLKGS